MKRYRVLVVDDDKQILEDACHSLDSIPNLDLVAHDSVGKAIKELQRAFFNLAIVDLEFDSRMDGTRIFKFLQDERPSCHAILLTQHIEQAPSIFRLLDPVKPQIVAAINKLEVGPQMKAAVEERARKWLGNPVTIGDCDKLLADLKSRRNWYGKAETSVDELDYLLSRVFGQGQYRMHSRHEISTAQLETMTGGRSSSIVLKCRPQTAAGRPGIWSVTKVGPRHDAVAEYERYCRFVRYLVSLDARVELLAFEAADTLGAMCYSFAGRTPSGVCSFGDLLKSESDRVFKVLDNLFKKESQCWYAIAGSPMSPGAYLHEVHAFESEPFLKLARSTLMEVTNRERASKMIELDPYTIELEHASVSVPKTILGAGLFRKEIPTCIVHGDMNASNLIVSEDDRVIMIDYRHTDFALRTIDFAALECSLRLSIYSRPLNFNQASAAQEFDRLAWMSAWGNTDHPSGENEPFWSRVSRMLIRHARENFPDLTPVEYALTCFTWAVRVGKLQQISHEDRFRLLVWQSFLQQQIRQ